MYELKSIIQFIFMSIIIIEKIFFIVDYLLKDFITKNNKDGRLI